MARGEIEYVYFTLLRFPNSFDGVRSGKRFRSQEAQEVKHVNVGKGGMNVAKGQGLTKTASFRNLQAKRVRVQVCQVPHNAEHGLFHGESGELINPTTLGLHVLPFF